MQIDPNHFSYDTITLPPVCYHCNSDRYSDCCDDDHNKWPIFYGEIIKIKFTDDSDDQRRAFFISTKNKQLRTICSKCLWGTCTTIKLYSPAELRICTYCEKWYLNKKRYAGKLPTCQNDTCIEQHMSRLRRQYEFDQLWKHSNRYYKIRRRNKIWPKLLKACYRTNKLSFQVLRVIYRYIDDVPLKWLQKHNK